jgi:hypothetical protein
MQLARRKLDKKYTPTMVAVMLDGGVMAKGPPNWKGSSLGCKDSDSKLGGRKKMIGTRY